MGGGFPAFETARVALGQCAAIIKKKQEEFAQLAGAAVVAKDHQKVYHLLTLAISKAPWRWNGAVREALAEAAVLCRLVLLMRIT